MDTILIKIKKNLNFFHIKIILSDTILVSLHLNLCYPITIYPKQFFQNL